MIAISAASGALGRLVISHLRSRAEVVAVVRDPERAPEGVPVRRGDYDDPASLREAFDGADRLLLISSPELDPTRRIRQHLAAVAAAKDVGVGAIVFTSFLGADTVATGMTEAYHATEQAILDSGLPYTLLRHPFYSDAFVQQVSSGEITSSTGGRSLNTAFRSRLGRSGSERADGRRARGPGVRLHRASVELSRSSQGAESDLPRGAGRRPGPHELDLCPGTRGRVGTTDP